MYTYLYIQQSVGTWSCKRVLRSQMGLVAKQVTTPADVAHAIFVSGPVCPRSARPRNQRRTRTSFGLKVWGLCGNFSFLRNDLFSTVCHLLSSIWICSLPFARSDIQLPVTHIRGT